MWKVCLVGYEEVCKLFSFIIDEKLFEFNKYVGLMKKFVIDINVFV